MIRRCPERDNAHPGAQDSRAGVCRYGADALRGRGGTVPRGNGINLRPTVPQINTGCWYTIGTQHTEKEAGEFKAIQHVGFGEPRTAAATEPYARFTTTPPLKAES